ncbi:universal stress protein [Haloplanus salilacus]|uniref:universal stress protein n=1 Tax=Haloplanus salilacus TaxID=2949994 RepID=UPI0030D5A064
MFDDVLIAVDGSECARRAAKHGFELAARYDAEATVVTVYGGADERGRAVLDETAALATDVGVPVESELLSGKPASTIAGRAADGGADLVVVGRQGRSGVAKRILGSVTERLLRRSDVPVLTVPAGDIEDDTGADYGTVLATTDGSEVAERVAPYGADIARRFGATLHALSVVDIQAEAGVFNAGGVGKEFVERLETRGRQAVDDLVDGIDTADFEVRTSVVRGTAHDAIADYVDDEGVDLLVMSSEGQTNLAGQQLGTVTGRVLRSVDRPVLVVTGD